MSALDEIAAAVRTAAERVGPAVVSVNRRGSGLVVGKGVVVTNAHNLHGEGALVQFPDGRQETATVAGVDVDGDLAVLSVETGTAPSVAFVEREPELGQVVVALANPRGRGLRATVGTVSSLGRAFRGPRGRRISGGIEHTAPLGRGSSGGPVADAEGRLVGVNTHRFQEGFYLAVPADADLRRRIDQLAAGQAPTLRHLGAAILPPEAARHLRAAAGLPEVEGVLIRGVRQAGPADRAGLRRGDVIVEAAGRPIRSVDDLYAALDGEGDLELKIVRATEEVTVTVRFDPDTGPGGEGGTP